MKTPESWIARLALAGTILSGCTAQQNQQEIASIGNQVQDSLHSVICADTSRNLFETTESNIRFLQQSLEKMYRDIEQFKLIDPEGTETNLQHLANIQSVLTENLTPTDAEDLAVKINETTANLTSAMLRLLKNYFSQQLQNLTEEFAGINFDANVIDQNLGREELIYTKTSFDANLHAIQAVISGLEKPNINIEYLANQLQILLILLAYAESNLLAMQDSMKLTPDPDLENEQLDKLIALTTDTTALSRIINARLNLDIDPQEIRHAQVRPYTNLLLGTTLEIELPTDISNFELETPANNTVTFTFHNDQSDVAYSLAP